MRNRRTGPRRKTARVPGREYQRRRIRWAERNAVLGSGRWRWSLVCAQPGMTGRRGDRIAQIGCDCRQRRRASGTATDRSPSVEPSDVMPSIMASTPEITAVRRIVIAPASLTSTEDAREYSDNAVPVPRFDAVVKKQIRLTAVEK